VAIFVLLAMRSQSLAERIGRLGNRLIAPLGGRIRRLQESTWLGH
jgi:hypothetical protein